MPLSAEGQSLLLEAAKELGFHLGEEIERFSRFYDLLLEGNRVTNLTSITNEREVVLKHFADSLSCDLRGHLSGSLRVMDIGTGAGFPGVPLCIARPDLDMVLVDATHKKVDFLDKVRLSLPLGNARTLWGRAEEIARQLQHRESYDRVVTRAVSPLNTLYELCLPFLKVGGYLVAQKGPEARDEVEKAGLAAEKLGGRLVEVVPLKLPVLGDPRCLVIVEKILSTPDKYPRRSGVPQKNPLF
ncbi:MAG: 16S rRNA (guanine(527)-N(7))-methyltransferase RsmG [Meiothermus sp.]